MRCVFVLMLINAMLVSTAQVKFDANWTFGHNCGLSFQDTANPTPFYSVSENLESSAAISDSAGNLLFYIGNKGNWDNFYPDIYNADNLRISRGDSIKAHLSATNGTSIIPISDNSYLIFQIDIEVNKTSCGTTFCNYLSYSMVSIIKGEVVITDKNIILNTPNIQEKLITIRHANGKDWWIILHEQSSISNCTNRYIKFLIQDERILGPYFQNVGYSTCSDYVESGEFTFNGNKNIIAASFGHSRVIDLLSFNRCDGALTQIDTISYPGLYPYGLAFSHSSKYLYTSVNFIGGPSNSNQKGLYQLKLDSNHAFRGIDTLFYMSSFPHQIGQLANAPNGKIYLVTGTGENIRFNYNTSLSVINQPDSAWPACDFVPFSQSLNDSCITRLGLPNMPNYNLGAIGAYRMNAGLNQTICEGDSTVKGVQIGSPEVAGLSYQWLNTDLDSTTRRTAQITVNPTQSTWYYLEVSDSTATNSCTSYIDSVLVEVAICTGIEDHELKNINVYPNPAKDKLHIQGLPVNETVSFQLLNLQGQQVYTQQLEQETVVDISQLASGIYIYTLTTQKEITTGKVVIE